jgi:hypothetical protein
VGVSGASPSGARRGEHAMEMFVVSVMTNPWVRRLWPEEPSPLERTDAESRRASHDVAPARSRIHAQQCEWTTSRWPCWPESWPRGTDMRAQP